MLTDMVYILFVWLHLPGVHRTNANTHNTGAYSCSVSQQIKASEKLNIYVVALCSCAQGNIDRCWFYIPFVSVHTSTTHIDI